jgi:Dihydrofolate reductase
MTDLRNPRVEIIVARADNVLIGHEGRLPWHLPADLRRFKSATMGGPMIMGRETLESLPGLLPGREPIVVTRDSDWQADGVKVDHSRDGYTPPLPVSQRRHIDDGTPSRTQAPDPGDSSLSKDVSR